MRAPMIAVGLLFALLGHAGAQQSVSVPADPSQFDAAGAASAVQAQIPQPASTPPMPDALVPAVGTPGVYQPAAGIRKLTYRSTTIPTTGTAGAFSVTWSVPLVSSTPSYDPPFAVLADGSYGTCTLTTHTSTTAAGSCRIGISVLGIITLTTTAVPVGTLVTVTGREPTQ